MDINSDHSGWTLGEASHEDWDIDSSEETTTPRKTLHKSRWKMLMAKMRAIRAETLAHLNEAGAQSDSVLSVQQGSFDSRLAQGLLSLDENGEGDEQSSQTALASDTAAATKDVKASKPNTSVLHKNEYGD